MKRTMDPLALITSRVEVDENECWLWTGGTTERYARLKWNGKGYAVHKFIYELMIGPLPETREIGHSCHYEDSECMGGECKHRRCVNPKHLESMVLDPLAFMRRRIDIDQDGCWLWKNSLTDHGYGYVKYNGDNHRVHRVMYELLIGPIPPTLDLDHLCHNRDSNCSDGDLCKHRRCCNPEHLEPVDHAENIRRSPVMAKGTNGYGEKTHCKNGHEFTPENTRVWIDVKGLSHRRCLECGKLSMRRRRAKDRADGSI